MSTIFKRLTDKYIAKKKNTKIFFKKEELLFLTPPPLNSMTAYNLLQICQNEIKSVDMSSNVHSIF